MKLRLGIDLGGTSAKIAIVNERSKILSEASVPTAGFPRADDLVKKITEVCRELLGQRKIARVGIGVAGDIDSTRGVVRVSPNLGWKNVPLARLMQKRMKVPVVVENDANAAAWGLFKTQVPTSVKHLIVMTLGTGVGGGLIVDGRLLSGATGSAGEVGHMVVDDKGPLCNCGTRGCLETYVGGPHIVDKVRRALKAGRPSSLKKLEPSHLTPLAVSQAALKGDALAKRVWEEAGWALGRAVGDLIYILNPQMIIFTGGVAQAKDLILRPMKKVLSTRAFQTPIKAVRIKVADNASHVGVIGASFL